MTTAQKVVTATTIPLAGVLGVLIGTVLSAFAGLA